MDTSPQGMSHQPNNIFAGTQVVSLVEVLEHFKEQLGPRSAGFQPAGSGSIPAPRSNADESKQ